MSKINPKILATWLPRDQEALNSHLGLNWPHHQSKDKVKIKFKDYTDSKDYADLASELNTIQRYKGIRELLGKTENGRLVQFLRKEFPDFNTRELWTAMDMASAPDNPFELKYGGQTLEFTSDYLSRILGPYRKYRAALINRYLDAEIQLAKNESAAQVVPEVLTDEKTKSLALAFDIKFCKITFDNFTSKCPVAGLDRVYDIFEKHKLLSFTTERLNDFKETAKENLNKAAKNDGRVRSLMQAFEKGLPVGVTTLEMEAKNVAMRVLFREMQEMDITLEEKFSSLNKGLKPKKSPKKAIKINL